MGSNVFFHPQRIADARAAFRAASQEAGYTHGHGYSGSLAEKHDFTIIHARPMWEDQAVAEANRLIDAGDPRIDDKWGPAGAIPFICALNGVTPATHTKRIKMTAEGRLNHHELRARVQADLPADAVLTDLRAGGSFMAAPDAPAGPKVTAAVKAAAPKAKTVTRYVVLGSREHSTWATGFPTQAAARAWACETLKSQTGDIAATLEIEAVTRRATGEPLVQVTRDISKVTYEVDVTYITCPPIPAGTTPDGWLFFGWASS